MSVPKAGALAKASDWTTVFPVDTDAWPTWTPAVVQSGAVTATAGRAAYMKIGRLVFYDFTMNITGTGTAANIVTVSLPVGAAGIGATMMGDATIFDTSAADTITGLARLQSATTISFLSTRANGVLGTTTFTAALASGDIVRCAGFYESSS